MSAKAQEKALRKELWRKEVWIGWIGSLVEAYNMAIYSFIAPFIAPMLFPHGNTLNSLFFSYSLVFVGSCLLYPAGAIYYGMIGDKFGRQKICIYSTLGLGVATGLMAFVPLNEGWIYFLILICAQHFFSGGEYHGSIVFSLEHAESKQNGFASSLSCLFAVFGLIAANGLATFSKHPLSIRLCFILGGIGGVLSYILKAYCRETPAFSSLARDSLKEHKLLPLIQKEFKTIAKVVTILAFFSISYSFIFIFLPLTGQNLEQLSTFKSLILYGFFLVLSGLLADRIGIRLTMSLGLSLFAILIVPLTLLSQNLLLIQIVLTLVACCVIGPIHSWILNQFIVSQRCRGIFISAAIATSIFGGSTVPICLMIFEHSHSLWVCSLYPLTISLLGLFMLGSSFSLTENEDGGLLQESLQTEKHVVSERYNVSSLPLLLSDTHSSKGQFPQNSPPPQEPQSVAKKVEHRD